MERSIDEIKKNSISTSKINKNIISENSGEVQELKDRLNFAKFGEKKNIGLLKKVTC